MRIVHAIQPRLADPMILGRPPSMLEARGPTHEAMDAVKQVPTQRTKSHPPDRD